MDQCSFAFMVVRQKWGWTEDTGLDQDQREIQEVNLNRGDVSIVTQGANPFTPVTARALLLGMSDEELAELPQDVLERLQRAKPAEPTAAVHSLDYYRARAYALNRKG